MREKTGTRARGESRPCPVALYRRDVTSLAGARSVENDALQDTDPLPHTSGI